MRMNLLEAFEHEAGVQISAEDREVALLIMISAKTKSADRNVVFPPIKYIHKPQRTAKNH